MPEGWQGVRPSAAAATVLRVLPMASTPGGAEMVRVSVLALAAVTAVTEVTAVVAFAVRMTTWACAGRAARAIRALPAISPARPVTAPRNAIFSVATLQ